MKKTKNSILYNKSNKTGLSGNSWKHKVLYCFFCDQIAESQPGVTGGNWHTSSTLQIHQHFQVSHISSFIGSNFLVAFQVSLNKQCSCSSLHAMPCCNDKCWTFYWAKPTCLVVTGCVPTLSHCLTWPRVHSCAAWRTNALSCLRFLLGVENKMFSCSKDEAHYPLCPPTCAAVSKGGDWGSH